MGVFIIATTHTTNDAVLKGRITLQFPGDYYDIGRGQWLVAFNGTAQELYTKLISDVPAPLSLKGTVIFGVGGYYGVASRDMWEWMANKLGGRIV